MILPMKKVHIIATSAHNKSVISDVKALGLVHVLEQQVQSAEIDAVRTKQAEFRKASAVLGDLKKSDLKPVEQKNLPELCSEILALGEELRHYDEEIDKVQKEINRIQVWSNFEPKVVKDLQTSGLSFKVFALAASDEKKLTNIKYIKCWQTKTSIGLVVFETSEALPASAEELQLPELSLLEYQNKIKSIVTLRQETSKKVDLLKPFKPSLEKAADLLDLDLEEAIVHASLNNDGSIIILNGFVPEKNLPELRKWAQEKAWGIIVSDPSSDDSVPTLLENPKPVRMLKPILDFLGTVPGYTERDISHWFLIFLTVFFAMIIGDGFYGLILLTLGLGVGIKIKTSGKPIPAFIPLLITFSLATITWGTITGTWLGLDEKFLPDFLKNLRVPFLTDPEMGQKNVQLLCFVMGLGHLLLAHILRFFRELKNAPHIHAFAQLGWASVIFGAFWLVLNVVLDPKLYPVPPFAIWFIAGGMAGVFLFEKQEAGKSFIKGVLSALGNVITTALSGVSAFADVISYIRLFAVGLAGLAIAQSFNNMAQGSFESGGVGILVGTLIMFLGHTLNLIMGALSVVVHGVRLNMLEYSSHIGLEWTGYAYKPFKQEA